HLRLTRERGRCTAFGYDDPAGEGVRDEVRIEIPGGGVGRCAGGGGGGGGSGGGGQVRVRVSLRARLRLRVRLRARNRIVVVLARGALRRTRTTVGADQAEVAGTGRLHLGHVRPC